MSDRAWRAVLAGAVILALGAGALEAGRETWLSKPLPRGSPAPRLTGTRPDGARFELERTQAVTLVAFWASWCGPCRRELPVLARLAREYRDHGVRLVTLNLDEPGDRDSAVAGVTKSLGADAPLVAYPDDASINAWKAHRLPTVYLVGRDGRIAEGHSGALGETAIRRQLEAALADAGP